MQPFSSFLLYTLLFLILNCFGIVPQINSKIGSVKVFEYEGTTRAKSRCTYGTFVFDCSSKTNSFILLGLVVDTGRCTRSKSFLKTNKKQGMQGYFNMKKPQSVFVPHSFLRNEYAIFAGRSPRPVLESSLAGAWLASISDRIAPSFEAVLALDPSVYGEYTTFIILINLIRRCAHVRLPFPRYSR